MIFLLQYLTIKNLIICLLILYTITLVVQQNQNRKKIYTKEFLEANNARPLVVLKHLDYYYVTNIYYTVIAVFLYIGFTVLLLIYLRYTFIGYQRMLVDISLTNAGLHLLWVLLLFSIIFILYRRFLDIIFYPHVIRLHFYLYSNKYYHMWVDFEQTNYHIGSYLGSYSASLYSYVTFDYELQNKHMKEWDDKYIPDIVQRRASVINKTTSLKDIQEYIKSLYDNFFRLKNTIDNPIENLSAKPSQLLWIIQDTQEPFG